MSITHSRYMMATTAIHQLGDISREKADICQIYGEDADNFIGNWVTGFGFIDVKFPKATTRDLTEEEIKHFDGKRFRIDSQGSWPIKVR